MKQKTEKPSDSVMRFFTPELYLQFNSSDDQQADLADAAWEAALADYERHLTDIRDRLPSQAGELLELDFHDALVVAPLEERDWDPSESSQSAGSVGILTLQQHEEFLSLIYSLWKPVRRHAAPPNWPFAKSPVHWLYDEFDIFDTPDDPGLHRILFSDGSQIEIPFQAVVVHKFQSCGANHSSAVAKLD